MLKVGDRAKVRGTRETYDLGIQNKLGTIIEVRAGGELVHLQLDMGGRVCKLSCEEVTLATPIDETRAARMRPSKELLR